MSLAEQRMTSKLRRFDKDLYARRNLFGHMVVMRRNQNPAAYEYMDGKLSQDQFIIALTDNWALRGKPVEWGYEPIYSKLREMDSWSRQTLYEEFCKARELREQDEERQRTNELHAHLADIRKDFAKATNDIIVRKE